MVRSHGTFKMTLHCHKKVDVYIALHGPVNFFVLQLSTFDLIKNLKRWSRWYDDVHVDTTRPWTCECKF